MSRGESVASAGSILLVALVVRLWAASMVTFPRPEDVAYYVGVARNLLAGHGLTIDAIWSYATPPLSFPRPAFEIWLPMPTFLAAVPMAILGSTFAAAQWSSIVVGSLVPVLAWRLGTDAAVARGLPLGRVRTLGLGAGLTAAVYLPLVLHSVEPDSTMPFAALSLAACLLMARLVAAPPRRALDVRLAVLGVLLGLAALTRNEVAWLALGWAILAWRTARRPAPDRSPVPIAGGLAGETGRRWLGLVALPAIVALGIYAPWLARDWAVFGTPFPGQALTNALFIRSSDVFAWQDPPTLSRYLGQGVPAILGQHWTGFVHDVVVVLLALGIPISAIGLVALPWSARGATWRALGPLVLVSSILFVATTLLFPVATLSGTFLHAAGAIHVLLIVSALVGLDALIAAVGRRRGWTRPVAWLGPTLTVSAGLLFVASLLPTEGRTADQTAARYRTLGPALVAALGPDAASGTLISDAPIWLADATGSRSIALPDEPPSSVLDLAHRFGATALVVSETNEGIWPEVLEKGGPGSACFEKIALPGAEDAARPDQVAVYRIRCR